MKKSKCIRGWAKFDLFIAILAGIVAGVACLLRWLIGGGKEWLMEITKKIAGKPYALEGKFSEYITTYLKNDYILIAIAVFAAFLLLAIILFVAAKRSAKKAAKAEAEAAEAVAEEEAVVSVDCAEVAEAEGEEDCGYVCIFSGYVKDIKKMSKQIADKVKAKMPEKLDKETLKKAGKIALPVVAGCIFTATVVSNYKYKKKAKRRRQFYEWMG